jgi:hypothetical protein
VGAGLHIEDLARPRLPRPIRVGNALAGPVVRRVLRLDPERLLASARRRARLDDPGSGDAAEPLGVLVDALERESHPTALGRGMPRELLVGLLMTRLRLAALRSYAEGFAVPEE